MKGVMLTLVQIRNAHPASADAASLMADYLAFDKRRTERRQYQKAFGGMAIIVLVGAVFGRVPSGQAEIVAGLLLAVPLVLGIIEMVHWRRLVVRLDRVRADLQSIESRKKVIKTEAAEGRRWRFHG
jgi:hypothetical protein